MSDIIQLRRSFSYDWVTCNPTLADGEFGFEIDTAKFKIGDGVNAWVDLPYWITQGGTGIQGDTGIQGYTGVRGIQNFTEFDTTQYPSFLPAELGWSQRDEALFLGVTGMQWIQLGVGFKSMQGVTGFQGITGILGIDGVTGISGVTGFQGITGFQGDTGIQGYTGLALGSTGIAGVQGVTGIYGLTGIAGPGTIGFIMRGDPSDTILTGIKGEIQIPFDATFTGWTLTADQTGYAYIELYDASYAGYPTGNLMSQGTTGIYLDNAIKNTGTMSGWTETSIVYGNLLQCKLVSDSTINRLSLNLGFSRL